MRWGTQALSGGTTMVACPRFGASAEVHEGHPHGATSMSADGLPTSRLISEQPAAFNPDVRGPSPIDPSG